MKVREDTLSDSASTGVKSVGEFTQLLKTLIYSGLRAGWVRGEISNLRAQASGHVYFSLKDATAQLACVLFRGDAIRQGVALCDGMQVLAYGKVDVYETRGQYQLIVRAIIDHGAGRLQQEFEKLKKNLATEGLFDPARKRPLSAFAKVVGFVTSPTGAAVQDFIRILRRRKWRGWLVVLPAKVQGASDELIAMLKVAESLGIFDLLVIGRGGGSIEDLWVFNEEPLVRAVVASPVPVISSVGHEIDFTLCDFAADVRAETPSAAAELISSQRLAAIDRIERAREFLATVVKEARRRSRERLVHAASRLRLLSPQARVEQHFLQLDDCASRLRAALRHAVQERRGQLNEVRGCLEAAAPQQRIEMESYKLLALWKRLQAASPESVLERGFAIVRDKSGRPIGRAAQISAGQTLVNEFSDGCIDVRVE